MTWNEVCFHSSVGDVKLLYFFRYKNVLYRQIIFLCVIYFIMDQLRTINGNNDQSIKFKPTPVEFWNYIKSSKTLVTLLCLDIFIIYITLLSPSIWIHEKYDYTVSQLNFCSNGKMCWCTQTASLKCKISHCIILWFWYHTHVALLPHKSVMYMNLTIAACDIHYLQATCMTQIVSIKSHIPLSCEKGSLWDKRI